MSAVENFLARLDKVKRTGPDRWIACCPSHNDKRPSLAIRELNDGRVLIKDFGGCGAADVLASVGMSFADLYPDTKEWKTDGKPKERRPFFALDILRCVASELQIGAVASCNLRQGIKLSDEDHARVMLAAERLNAAVDHAI